MFLIYYFFCSIDMYFCYILKNNSEKYKNYTYNGYTVNPWRRIRQHNGELVGGAKYTTGVNSKNNKEHGDWEMCVLITGFKTSGNALSCEWKIKHPTGKKTRPKKYCGIEGRIKSLNEVLILDSWTMQCKVKNSECDYIMFVINEYMNLLDLDKIPKNIKIIPVEKINKDTVESFIKDKVDEPPKE